MIGSETEQAAGGWLRSAWRRFRGQRDFRCNTCGAAQRGVPEVSFDREIASCKACGSTVRMRSIVHALSVELFGKCTALPDFPVRPDLVGAGMSDWDGYAVPLAAKLGYRNTFLHQPPHLDILAPLPDEFGTFDFLISTDVFEHVVPPVQIAFDNARRLLKPSGVFIFSVPYNLEGTTVEHFPDLHEFRIEEPQAGQFVLHNKTREGEEQVFKDLIFHGGPGTTLEMRVFSLGDLLTHLDAAGFRSPTIHSADHPDCGMVHKSGWSLTMSVRPKA